MTRRQKARLAAFVGGVLLILFGWMLAGGRGGGGGASASARATGGPGSPAAAGGGRTPPGAFSRRNPFRIALEHAPPAPTPEPGPVQVAAAPPPPQVPDKPLPVRLIGTMSGDPLGIAFLRNLQNGDEFLLAVGGDLGTQLGREWQGVLLSEVSRNRIAFVRAGRPQVLEVDYADMAGPATAPGAAVPPPGEPGGEPPPAPTGVDGPPAASPVSQHPLARAEVDENLKNLGNLITQLNVQPFFQGGQPGGFRVSRIRPGSFVDKLGAQNGDIVQDVNGKPITTIKDAFLLYNSFKVENAVKVRVLRGGQPHVLDFQIR